MGLCCTGWTCVVPSATAMVVVVVLLLVNFAHCSLISAQTRIHQILDMEVDALMMEHPWRDHLRVFVHSYTGVEYKFGKKSIGHKSGHIWHLIRGYPQLFIRIRPYPYIYIIRR